MAGSMATSYWCYMCRQRVNPIMELQLTCPFCESGFVEEITGWDAPESEELGSERAISARASVLAGMMGNPFRQHGGWRLPRAEDGDNSDLEHELEPILQSGRQETGGDALRMEEGDRESNSVQLSDSTAQRMRTSAREDLTVEPFEAELQEEDIEVLYLIDSDRTMTTFANPSHESDMTAMGAFIEDYFVGQGLEMLLQYLAENASNCYGTPPAQKEAIDALPVVKIEENLSCAVCLEDFEFGMQARKMPCDHKFHKDCIFPWLEIHSSCPVCRFQLPANETKSSTARAGEGGGGGGGDDIFRGRHARSRAPPSWPFSGMF